VPVLEKTCTECQDGEDVQEPYEGLITWVADIFRPIVAGLVGIDSADQSVHGFV
jgi:hypothetical protein